MGGALIESFGGGEEAAERKRSKMIAVLHAELNAAEGPSRRAHLSYELGGAYERAGDLGAAVAHYIEAVDATGAHGEALENLIALLSSAGDPAHLGQWLEKLLGAASTPDENARALLLKGAHLEAQGDFEGAKSSMFELLQGGASDAHATKAWLFLEHLSARAGDDATRTRSLEERARLSQDPLWRGVLQLERAAAAAAQTDFASAHAWLSKAATSASTLSFHVARTAEQYASTDGADPTGEIRRQAIATQHHLVMKGRADAAFADAHGVAELLRTPEHVCHLSLRLAELHERHGETDLAAEVIDSALAEVSGDEEPTIVQVLLHARRRLALRSGDVGAASRMAQKALAHEADPRMQAALWMDVANASALEHDWDAVHAAVAHAVHNDPTCVPARVLQFELLRDGDAGELAAAIEAFSTSLGTAEGRATVALWAAFVQGTRGRNPQDAKRLIAQAHGAAADVHRVAVWLARKCGDPAWYEEAVGALANVAPEAAERELLWLDVARKMRVAADDVGETRALIALQHQGNGALGLLLQAVTGTRSDEERAQLLATLVAQMPPSEASGIWQFPIAVMLCRAGQHAHAIERLYAAQQRAPSLLGAALIAQLHHDQGEPLRAAEASLLASTLTDNRHHACCLVLQAAFRFWKGGDPTRSLATLEAASALLPAAADVMAPWLERVGGASPARLDRRVAALLGKAAPSEGPHSPPSDAVVWAIAALCDPHPPTDETDRAVSTLAALGLKGAACVERVRHAHLRKTNIPQAAEEWFATAHDLPSAIERLAVAPQPPGQRAAALRRVATFLEGDDREKVMAHAALVDACAQPQRRDTLPMVQGTLPSTRLVALELAPPGTRPVRRANALSGFAEAMPREHDKALALAGWSLLSNRQADEALRIFERLVQSADSLANWEGLRSAAEMCGAHAQQARAAAEVASRSRSNTKSSELFEQAGRLWAQCGDLARAEQALEESFERDPARRGPFDLLVQRASDRQDTSKIVLLAQRRLRTELSAADKADGYWQCARALRIEGRLVEAAEAIDHLLSCEPFHVEGLTLCAELHLKFGRYEEAAKRLTTIAQSPTAPAPNRIAAGVAAVDLYETKLQQFDCAVNVLTCLHQAGLLTLPVRERLLRASLRAATWNDALSLASELMNERTSAEGRMQAARLVLAMDRDRVRRPEAARRAVHRLLIEDATDLEALDSLDRTESDERVRLALYQRARDAFLDRHASLPLNAAALRSVARIASALSEADLECAALGLLQAFGDGDEQARGRRTQLAWKGAKIPAKRLTDIPFLSDGAVAKLLAIIAPFVALESSPSLSSLDVSKKDRVDPRSDTAQRDEIAAWAEALLLNNFELYVSGTEAEYVGAIARETPTLVIGAGVSSPFSPPLRARIVRELWALASGTTLAAHCDDDLLEAIVLAACATAGVRRARTGRTNLEVSMAKALPRSIKKEIAPLCSELQDVREEVRGYRAHAVTAQFKMALVACGDASIVLKQMHQEAFASTLLGGVVTFALSREYLALRESLGVAL